MEALSHVYAELSYRERRQVAEVLEQHENIIIGVQRLLERRRDTCEAEMQEVERRVHLSRERLATTSDPTVQVRYRKALRKDEEDLTLLRKKDDFAVYCLWHEVLLLDHHRSRVLVALREYLLASSAAAEQGHAIWRSLEAAAEELCDEEQGR